MLKVCTAMGSCSVPSFNRITDPEFEGDWTPEEEYLHESLILQYSRSLYFSLIITYGNHLGKRSSEPRRAGK